MPLCYLLSRILAKSHTASDVVLNILEIDHVQWTNGILIKINSVLCISKKSPTRKPHGLMMFRFAF